jgi:protein SCO1/2
VQGLFITVDPERDTQETLKDYVSFFSKNIIGLSGTQAEIDHVTRQYSTTYRLNKKEGENYSVDHSANLYVINKDGQIHAVVPYGFPLQHVQKMVDSLIE